MTSTCERRDDSSHSGENFLNLEPIIIPNYKKCTCLEPVWYIYLNICFQFSNNITRIFTFFHSQIFPKNTNITRTTLPNKSLDHVSVFFSTSNFLLQFSQKKKAFKANLRQNHDERRLHFSDKSKFTTNQI